MYDLCVLLYYLFIRNPFICLIKNVILKYTMIKVENSEQNLLDLPVVEECWIYVIMELENTYNLPIIKLLDDIKVDEFNLQTICDKLNHIRKVAF